MRYQIFRLQQEALIDMGLNVEEALLLDWLLNWKDGGSMERIVIGEDLAYWVNYSKVIDELPILFNKPKSDSQEDIEKAKKSNLTKVARMLKGNLSKILTRHEKKVQGKTKIYISFNREMLDVLLNSKKAPSTAIDEASKSNKNQSNLCINSISQNKKKYTGNKRQNSNRFHNCRNKVLEYTEDELNKVLKNNEIAKNEKAESNSSSEHKANTFNIEECAQKSLMDKEYFESLEAAYRSVVVDYVNSNGIFKPSWIK